MCLIRKPGFPQEPGFCVAISGDEQEGFYHGILRVIRNHFLRSVF
jgi:hypothetical protein